MNFGCVNGYSDPKPQLQPSRDKNATGIGQLGRMITIFPTSRCSLRLDSQPPGSFSMAAPPQHEQDQQNRYGLQDDPHPHEILRAVWASSPQHVDEAEHQDDGDGTDRGADEEGSGIHAAAFVAQRRRLRESSNSSCEL
jgi:hypothetical protein